MSLPVFPSGVRGLTYPRTKQSEFRTLTQEASNFMGTFVAQAKNPRWTWELIYNYLYADPNYLTLNGFPLLNGYADYQTLQGFLLSLQGSSGEFLYDDPSDDYVGPGLIAGAPNLQAQLQVVQDSATGTYYSPVQRNFGGQFLEDITDVLGFRVPTTMYGGTNASGSASMFKSRPLGHWTEGVVWGGFDGSLAQTTLPADVTITGIYPVIVISSVTHDRAYEYFRYGPGYTPDQATLGPGMFTSPSNPESTTLSTQTTFYDTGSGVLAGKGIGTSLAALKGQTILAQVTASLFNDGLADALSVVAVGYAVYYTASGSSPIVVDTSLPAPFTVPAGSGLFWALPTWVTATGPTNTGTSSGLLGSCGGATRPYGQIKVYDNGALKQAGVDYVLLGPGLGITGASYAGLYLRWLNTPVGPVTAEFNFYFRCRAGDIAEFTRFTPSLWTAGGGQSKSGAGLTIHSVPPVQV